MGMQAAERPPAGGCKAWPSHEAELPDLEPALVNWLERRLGHELRSMNDKLDKLLEQAPPSNTRGSAESECSFGKQPRAHANALMNHGSGGSSSYRGRASTCSIAMALEDVLAAPKSGQSAPKPSLRSSLLSSQSGRLRSSAASLAAVNSCGQEASVEVGSTPLEEDMERAEMMLYRKQLSTRHTITQVAWEFLEVPESSIVAWAFAVVTPIFILASVFLTLAQSHKDSPLHGVHAAVLETAVEVIFVLEVVTRMVCCPNPRVFFVSAYNIIDVLAAVPLVVRATIGFVLPTGDVASTPHAVLLCAVPVIRLLKTLRRFEKFKLILNAFQLAFEALPVMLFILSIIALTFAMLIYLVEPRDNVESIPRAVWFTIVTMSTVGYGDLTPKSTLGHMFTGVLIVITALYMAIPLGIVGNAFSSTWEARDKILLMHRTRDRLIQRGFSAADIPALFHLAAKGHHGQLGINEFRNLLVGMQLGLSEERIMKLFQSFDTNSSGSLDDRQFVRHLFPSTYHAIYSDEAEADLQEEEIASQHSEREEREEAIPPQRHNGFGEHDGDCAGDDAKWVEPDGKSADPELEHPPTPFRHLDI